MKKTKLTAREAANYLILWQKFNERVEKWNGENDAEFDQGTFIDGYRQALNDFCKALEK